MLSREELIGLQAMALAKHVAHVEEIREKVTKEKIRRTLQLERDLQHKVEEFNLGPGSLVLVKNSAIEMSVNRKMKPRYLGSLVVVRKSQGGRIKWQPLEYYHISLEENLTSTWKLKSY